jgi:preprotein translocase subunit SecB
MGAGAGEFGDSHRFGRRGSCPPPGMPNLAAVPRLRRLSPGCAAERRLLPAGSHDRGRAAAATIPIESIDMAEEEGAAGAPEQQTNGGDSSPQVGFISQYVKDLSFENPNAPAVYQWQTQPRIEVDFNIGATKLNDEIHEVTLKVEVRAAGEDQTAFVVDLLYGGLVGMRNVPEEQVQPFLLAEAPRILFPFARQIVSQTVQDGGFPPLLLDPIDFGALYMQRAAQAQAAESGGTAGEIGGEA